MTEKRVPTKRDYGGGLSHPAPYGQRLYPIFANLLMPGWRVIDPMAGVGGVHELRKFVPGLQTFGVELEPEWAALHPDTHVGNATRLRNRTGTFDAMVVSPCFGNRLADHHNASDPEGRRSYTHDLGRPLTKGNAGSMHWGEEYRALHDRAWGEAFRVVRSGGLGVLNIKDHIRAGDLKLVSMWHATSMTMNGWLFLPDRSVALGGKAMHTGENKNVRADYEYVLTFLRP